MDKNRNSHRFSPANGFTIRSIAVSWIAPAVGVLLFGTVPFCAIEQGRAAGQAADQAADPVWYQRQATWEETVRISREAITAAEKGTEAADDAAKQQRKTRRAELMRLVHRDFCTGPLAIEREMGDSERIWRDDWKPGDFRSLASRYRNDCRGELQQTADALARECQSAEDLEKVRALWRLSVRCRRLIEQMRDYNVDAARRAVEDLSARFADRYAAAKHRAAVEKLAAARDAMIAALEQGKADAIEPAASLMAAARDALLANPLLGDGKLLFVRRNMSDAARHDMRSKLGFISLNSHCHVTIGRNGWDDEIAVLDGIRGEPTIKTLYKPESDIIVRDLDLDYSGDRLMFSSLDERRHWAAFEIKADGSAMKQVSPPDYPEVEWFDPCYLPDGRVVLLSTASLQGLPCENGSRPMAQVYLLDPKTGQVRQLTFEQDSDYTPSITNDGRILYTRWEYSDLPHYFSRIVMTMNPDGTSQLARYGSGSYYPTTLLQARVVPGDADKFVGIISGHHDLSEIGRLVMFDPSLARAYPLKIRPKDKIWGKEGSFLRIENTLPAEESGCVAEFPGYGKPVDGDVCDQQVGNQFDRGKPYFVYPWPLDDRYCLVSAKRKNGELWGIYLVDVFDNITLLAEMEGAALLEPIPFAPRKRPPVIPDRIKPGDKLATVHIANIYAGPGLKNIPPGTVKSLRVFAYHFAYVGTGGHASLGTEAGWDLKRVLGTVPVEEDGSVCFEIPANTPISLQPLDEEGASLQLMRSWLVGMPGERVSCVGCHEDNRTAIPTSRGLADLKPARKINAWHGEPRPFAFEFEVYPVVQKYCVGCHTGNEAPERLTDQGGVEGKNRRITMSNPHEAYEALHPYMRRPGPESDLAMLPPMEYHASTSPLIQMLKKGHHGVQVDQEAMERLYAWIDLNCTFRGKWNPGDFEGQPQKERRLELAQKFANVDVCPEEEYDLTEAAYKTEAKIEFVKPADIAPPAPDNLAAPGFPMTAEQAVQLQKETGATERTVALADGAAVKLVRIPAGSFVMGSRQGVADEQPRAVVKVEKPFWMGECEITNAQYRVFDAAHDTRYLDAHGKDHNNPGYIANHDDQPVARITWREAMDFCQWMSKQTGFKVTLPTEAQWEWAARAGTESRFFYGGLDDDFGKWANLADRGVRWNIVGFAAANVQPRSAYSPEANFPLHEERFEDKWFVVDFVGQYPGNPWGLKDIVGNVSEWTRSSYRPYPYHENDGRNDGNPAERKVARGGSWNSRPREAGSSIRLPYESYQKVHDVGFRVIVEE